MNLVPRSRRAHWLLLILAAGGICGAWWWTRPPRLNLLIVTLDTTRADRLGCYGYAPAATPVLDELAARGVLFERAYATAPLTLPSHASLFTGLYSPEHGVHTNGKSRLGEGVPTLAELCLARGYQTAAFVASFVLDSKFGLDRGFQTYGDDLTGTAPADEALHRYRSGDRVVDEALGWLEGHHEEPFCCWVHLYDPHAPYLEHEETFGDRFHGRPYDAEIAFVDVQVGRLLEFLKNRRLDERTLVVVVGDHGEGLGEHQERRHGQMLYNSTLHVPLIVAGPGGVPSGQRVAAPVSLIDLFPTLVDVLRLRPPHDSRPTNPALAGQSLLAAAREGTPEPRALYGETDEPLFESGWSPLRSLTTAQWKYIRTTRPELYDLAADPGETHNLAGERKEQLDELESQLAELEGRMRRREGTAVELTPEERRALVTLGYTGNNAEPAGGIPAGLPDIKDMIGHYNALEDARILIDTGRYQEAARSLTALVAAAPDYELAEVSLGDAYFRQRKLDEALAIYQRVLKRNPNSAIAGTHVGDVREAQGRYEEALGHYQKALELEPDSAKLHYNLGRVLVLLGRSGAAIPHFEQAVELDPGYVFAHIELGTALWRESRPQEALVEYQKALEYDANSVHAHMNLAMFYAQQGRGDEALSHLESAAKISPRDPEVRFQLGAQLAAQGRRKEAAEHLSEAARLRPDDPRPRELLEQLRK